MSATATVSDVLDQRLHAGEPPRGVVPVVAFLAHALFLFFLAVISRPKPMRFVPTSVPVSIVRPSALGRPSPATVAPAPKAPPVIEKLTPDTVTPSAKALPLPKKTKEKPAKPAKPAKPEPSVAAAAPSLELPAASGAANGEAAGTSNFGASISSFDTDFPFGYYVEQLQSLIGANWLKPNVPDGTACVVGFKIQRSGQVTDVKVETPSGLPFYDRAATRSLYAANPLPPLPPEFKGEQLGVHLRFQ